MTEIDIRALAKLARVDVSDSEIETLEKEMPSILAFVETIQDVAMTTEISAPASHNVLRADEHPHEGGIYTEKLLHAAPHREGNKIVVKQVITRTR